MATNLNAATIELKRCEFQIMFTVTSIENLDEALGVAATELIRQGLDSLYILATNPDTDEQWVIHGDEILTTSETRERLQRAKEDGHQLVEDILGVPDEDGDEDGDGEAEGGEEAKSSAMDSLEG